MAFDFRCTRCGYKEGAHDCGEPGTCGSYTSEEPEAEAAMWADEKKRERAVADAQRRARGIPDDL